MRYFKQSTKEIAHEMTWLSLGNLTIRLFHVISKTFVSGGLTPPPAEMQSGYSTVPSNDAI